MSELFPSLSASVSVAAITSCPSHACPSDSALSAHAWFAAHADELRSRLRVRFRKLGGEACEEAISDATARIWSSLLSAQRRGTLGTVTPFHAVEYARAGFAVGRRFTGMSSTDVMGEAASARRRVRVVSLEEPAAAGDGRPTLSECLGDRRTDTPYEEVRRNCDYAYILDAENATPKVRRAFARLVERLGALPNLELARDLGVSPARSSQIKKLLAEALSRHDYRCPPVRTRQGRLPRRAIGRAA